MSRTTARPSKCTCSIASRGRRFSASRRTCLSSDGSQSARGLNQNANRTFLRPGIQLGRQSAAAGGWLQSFSILPAFANAPQGYLHRLMLHRPRTVATEGLTAIPFTFFAREHGA